MGEVIATIKFIAQVKNRAAILLRVRTARAQEAADARGDRGDGPRAVRGARLRGGARGRGRRGGRRLAEDRLQLLPDQGGPRLLAPGGVRGGDPRRGPRARQGRVRARGLPPLRADAARPDRRRRPGRPRGAARHHAHDHLQPGTARTRAGGLRDLHRLAGAPARGGDRRGAGRRRAVGRRQRADGRPSRPRAPHAHARPRRRCDAELAGEVSAQGERALAALEGGFGDYAVR